jgi:hypothetical protein
LSQVLRLKFLRPLRPGEHLRLELVRRGDARVDFQLLDSFDHAPVSSATLMFAGDGG